MRGDPRRRPASERWSAAAVAAPQAGRARTGRARWRSTSGTSRRCRSPGCPMARATTRGRWPDQRDAPGTGSGRALLRERSDGTALHRRPGDQDASRYLDFNGRGDPQGPVRQADDRSRACQRLHQLRVRSRLRSKRTVLHDSPRGVWRSPARRCPTTHASPDSTWLATRRRPGHHTGGVDHEGVLIEWTEQTSRIPEVRRPGARTAADSPEQPDPSARRSLLQSSGATRRSGLAGDVRRLRRRRGWRLARRLPSQSASGSTPWSGRSCASCPISRRVPPTPR